MTHSSTLERKGRLWVISDRGEEVRVTDRFRFEYSSPEATYVMETEPSLDGRPLYTRTLEREGSTEPLSPEEHERVLKRILVMLQFSNDPFKLIQ